MEKGHEYYEELIVRYFSGEADNNAISELSLWVKKSPENQTVFQDYQKTWLIVEQHRIEDTVNIDNEWDALQSKIQLNSQNESPVLKPDFSKHHKISFYAKALRIAAAIIVLAGSAWLIYQWVNKPVMQKAIAANTSILEKLPDGSSVTLNAGASLEYPDKFTGTQRNVTLVGEAYFDVAHDSKKPFIIDAGAVTIQVLGTSFYVNTRDTEGNTVVVLTNGKVKVSSKKDPSLVVILSPGEKAVFSETTSGLIKQQNEDINYMAWKTGKIRFENTSLSEIVSALRKIYRKDIRITGSNISDCRITATFENQSLDAILNIIKATIDITITRKGETIEISGNGCTKKQ